MTHIARVVMRPKEPPQGLYSTEMEFEELALRVHGATIALLNGRFSVTETGAIEWIELDTWETEPLYPLPHDIDDTLRAVLFLALSIEVRRQYATQIRTYFEANMPAKPYPMPGPPIFL